MNEASILQRIRLDLGREPSVRLFRNNTGAFRDATGRIVRFGLHPGSADLIGWRSIVITPDDVGRTLAVLASIEVKLPAGQPRHDQLQWASAVSAAGGFAGIARSTHDARVILGLPT
jgi:hypothetical protein